jgi:hypothetical protein
MSIPNSLYTSLKQKSKHRNDVCFVYFLFAFFICINYLFDMSTKDLGVAPI